MKTHTISTCLMALFLLAIPLHADLQEDIVRLVGDNATSYVHPLTNALGVGMNSGWTNSSKSYSFLKMPFGFQLYVGLPVTLVDDKLKRYDFRGTVAIDNMVTDPNLRTALKSAVGNKDSLLLSKKDAPTFTGEKKTYGFTFKQLLLSNGLSDTTSGLIGSAWATLPNDTVLYLPKGYDLDYLFSVPALGLNIGLPYKIQLGVRYVPPYTVPNVGKMSQFGLKAQYEFTEWIPGVKNLPLVHTSVMGAFNNANLFDILKLHNYTAMLNASADFKFLIGLGIYGGIGVERSTMTLDYTVPASYKGLGGTKVSLDDIGDNTIKGQAGVRLSLSVIDIMMDATFAKTQSYYLGLALSLNNL